MKYILFLLLIFFNSAFTNIHAQNTPKYQDVLYMKDSTVVRGIIIYMVPKKQVNIKVRDRRTGEEIVRTYQMSDIIKITKESTNARLRSKNEIGTSSSVQTTSPQSRQSPLNPKSGTDFRTPFMKPEETFKPTTKPMLTETPKPQILESPAYLGEKTVGTDPADINEMYKRLNKAESQWNRDIKGLRIFTEYAYTNGFGKVKNNRFDFATSIGYQNDPYFYFGVGITYGLTLNKKESIAPIYIHSRVNFIDEKVTPYIDMKTGYSLINDTKGIFLSPSFGLSLSPKGNSSLDFSIGYSYQKAHWKPRDKVNPSIRYNKKADYNGLTLKIIYSSTFWKF